MEIFDKSVLIIDPAVIIDPAAPNRNNVLVTSIKDKFMTQLNYKLTYLLQFKEVLMRVK